jgi:hypothetical protein
MSYYSFTENGLLLGASTIAAFSLVPLAITPASWFMLLLMLITIYVNINITQKKQQQHQYEWIKIAIAGFLIGSISDYLMNIIARTRPFNPANPNWANMDIYFKKVGTIKSYLFAGLLTAWMNINTFAITGITPVLSNHLPTIIAMTGFVVGALWGMVVESFNAKAAQPLMVFYKNTPGGYIENRIWDGLTIALASVLTWFVLR